MTNDMAEVWQKNADKVIMTRIKAEFDKVVDLVESLGDNGYKDVIWGGKEFTVGIDGSGRYTLLVRRRGMLYFDKLESFISDLFRLAIGDDWTENILWD